MVWLHISQFLGTRNLNPNRSSELGIESTCDVAFQAVTHHHSPIRRDLELIEKDVKDFRTRFPDSMNTGNSDGIKKNSQPRCRNFFTLEVRRSVRQKRNLVGALETGERFNRIRHKTLKLPPRLAKMGREFFCRIFVRDMLRTKNGVENTHSVGMRPLAQLHQLGLVTIKLAPKTLMVTDPDGTNVVVTWSILPEGEPETLAVGKEGDRLDTCQFRRKLGGRLECFLGNSFIHNQGIIQIKKNRIDRHTLPHFIGEAICR